MFIQETTIKIKSGSGGSGCKATGLSERKKIYPCGGDGGNGGSIYLLSDRNTHNFNHVKTSYLAENGKPGGSSWKHGSDGRNICIKLPIGTTCIDKYEGLVLGQLQNHNECLLIARGGRGGLGNGNKKIRRQKAYPGYLGVEQLIQLYRVNCYDLVLLGSYNTGKSTLFNLILKASLSEVADYPHTTKDMVIGHIQSADFKQYTIVDTPPIEKIIDKIHMVDGCNCKILYLVKSQSDYKYLDYLVDTNIIKSNMVWLISSVHIPTTRSWYKCDVISDIENITYIADQISHKLHLGLNI